MAYISTGTATLVNWKPKNETPLPIHIRRYATTRSGRTSITQLLRCSLDDLLGGLDRLLTHGASRSTTQPARLSAVAQPVVQAAAAALPELDGLRDHPQAAPVRRRGHRARRRTAPPPRPVRPPPPPGRRAPATAGWPRRRAGSRAAGWRSRPRSRPGPPAPPRRTPAPAAASGTTGRPGSAYGLRGRLGALARGVVGEEDETALVVPLEQHRAGRRVTVRDRRWRRSSRWAPAGRRPPPRRTRRRTARPSRRPGRPRAAARARCSHAACPAGSGHALHLSNLSRHR